MTRKFAMAPLPPLHLFDNFDLRFEAGTAPQSYRARVESPAGQATGKAFTLPPAWLTGGRDGHEADPVALERMGRDLFDLIFQGDVIRAYDRSQALAESKGKALRIRLRLYDTPELAGLPWELVAPANRNPLGLSPRTPIVHYLDLLETPTPLPTPLPLRILVVIASPASQPLLNGDTEWEALQTALRPLQAEGLVVLECLTNATYASLQATLQRGTPYHVLHYIGHSRFNEERQQGELLFESEDALQLEAPLAGTDFAQLLAEHRTTAQQEVRSLRLVYLNSCQGAVGQNTSFTAGIAHTLVQHGLPAVIAMQGYAPSRTAVALASHFYRVLAEGNPVDVALATARQRFRQETEARSAAWALPALFLRSDTSYLFALPGQVIPDAGVSLLPPAPGAPPYQGLAYYGVQDHARFFGREALTALLVQDLHSTPCLAVVGASGSGKSSLVRAGVLPTLLGLNAGVAQAQLPRDPGTWQSHLLTPTAHPFTALAVALTKDTPSVLAAQHLQLDLEADPAALDLYLRRRTGDNPNARILLVIDQFEELFTLCKSPKTQADFIATLFYALDRAAPLTLIMTLRADFYHKCTPFPALRQVLETHQRYIGGMSADELRRAIERSAQQGAWTFEQGLIPFLLEDAGAEPGTLPLLSHALRETWERRSGRTLTFAGYVAAGRIQGAIARTADETLARLSPETQDVARTLFIELTELGEGTQDTRRPVATKTLLEVSDNPGQMERLIHTLADARLLTTNTETTEVAHEALIREWGTLRRWVDADRAWVRFRRELARDARAWEQFNFDGGALYAGARLAWAVAETAKRIGSLSPLERDFLAKSEQQEVEAVQAKRMGEERRKRNVLLTRFAWALGTLLTVAVGLALVANQQSAFATTAQKTAVAAQQEAEAQRDVVASLRYAALAESAYLTGDKQTAALLAVEAGMRGDPLEAYGALHRSQTEEGRQLLTLRHEGVVFSAVWNQVEDRILTTSDDGTAGVWDAVTGARLLTLRHEGIVSSAAWNQAGDRILTASDDGTAGVWEGATGGRLLTLRHEGVVSSAVWNQAEDRILTTSNDGSTGVWDGVTGERLLTLGHETIVSSAVWNQAGDRILTESIDGTAGVWEGATGERLLTLRHEDVVSSAVWNQAGDRILTASIDGSVGVWDGATGERLLTLRHEAVVTSAVWNQAEDRILTASFDGVVGIWDGATGERLLTLNPEGFIISAVWNQAEDRILTASYDGTAGVWDAVTGERLLTLNHETIINSAIWNQAGDRILTASIDGSAGVWDATTGKRLPTLRHEDIVSSAVWNQAGNRILTASIDGTAGVWDGGTGVRLLTLRHEDIVSSAEWDQAEDRILTASYDGTAGVWDGVTGVRLLTLRHEDIVSSAVWNQAGERILTTSIDGSAGVWDGATGERLLTLRHEDRVNRAVWNEAGDRILTAGFDGTAGVWDGTTGERLLTLNHEGVVTSAVWNQAEERILTASNDGTAEVWDGAAGERLLTLNPEGVVTSAVWNEAGDRVLTASDDGTAEVWDGSTGERLLTLRHEANITSAVWNQAEDRILTASDDGSAGVWDGVTGERLLTLGHEGIVNSAVWNQAEDRILTASADGTVKVWNLSIPSLIATICEKGDGAIAPSKWLHLVRNDAYHTTCPAYSRPIGMAQEIAHSGNYARAVTYLEGVITEYRAWDDEFGLLPTLSNNAFYMNMLADPEGYLRRYAVPALWEQGRALAILAGSEEPNSERYNDLITQAAAKFEGALDLDSTFMPVEPREFAERVARREA